MLWTASEGCDRRAMQAILVTSWWLVIYGRASSAWWEGLNGRGRKSTRLGLATRCQMVSARLAARRETVGPSNFLWDVARAPSRCPALGPSKVPLI